MSKAFRGTKPGVPFRASQNRKRMTVSKIKVSSKIKKRLEELRSVIEAERISYGEITELQSLSKYIEPDDVLLLQWAGVPEGSRQRDR